MASITSRLVYGTIEKEKKLPTESTKSLFEWSGESRRSALSLRASYVG